jgi:hypothetical protein
MSAAFLIEKARRCRQLAQSAADPELRDQLLTFAREFEERAEEFAATSSLRMPPHGSWAH